MTEVSSHLPSQNVSIIDPILIEYKDAKKIEQASPTEGKTLSHRSFELISISTHLAYMVYDTPSFLAGLTLGLAKPFYNLKIIGKKPSSPISATNKKDFAKMPLLNKLILLGQNLIPLCFAHVIAPSFPFLSKGVVLLSTTDLGIDISQRLIKSFHLKPEKHRL